MHLRLGQVLAAVDLADLLQHRKAVALTTTTSNSPSHLGHGGDHHAAAFAMATATSRVGPVDLLPSTVTCRSGLRSRVRVQHTQKEGHLASEALEARLAMATVSPRNPDWTR
jgi:hypothetical protein